MSTIEKIITKLKRRPSDFKWKDVTKILLHFEYHQLEGGGSRIKFYNNEKNSLLNIHKPHNPKTLRPYQVDSILSRLKEDGYI